MNGTCTCKRSRQLVDTYANLSLFKREAGSAVGERSGDALPINYLCRTQENLLVSCCEDCIFYRLVGYCLMVSMCSTYAHKRRL